MDEHVESAITVGLRQRGVDVLTVQEDGRDQSSDSAVLDRAAELGRIVVTRDRDFLIEAAFRHRNGISFAGVIYAHLLRVSIGQCINDVEILTGASEPAEFANHVEYLPL
jgi:hypothetical protein